MTTVPMKIIIDVRQLIEDILDVSPDDETITVILRRNGSGLLYDSLTYGVRDTQIRGRLCDAVMRDLIGRGSIMFGERDISKVKTELAEAAVKRGWTRSSNRP